MSGYVIPDSVKSRKHEDLPRRLFFHIKFMNLSQQKKLNFVKFNLSRHFCMQPPKRQLQCNRVIQNENKKTCRKKENEVKLMGREHFVFLTMCIIEKSCPYSCSAKAIKKITIKNGIKGLAWTLIVLAKLARHDSGACDARTQLEVQGYSCWLQGTVLFELAEWSHEWAKPVEFFNKAKAIFSKLCGAVPEDEVDIYKSRLQELEVKLRFCRHHLGDRSATDTLLAMRGNEALGDKLDNLLASAREQQASTLSEVTWKGRTLAVKHEKVRLFLLNEGLIHDEVEKAASAEEQADMLDKLLAECKDAIQLLREDLRNDPSFKPRQQANEGPVSPVHFLHTYLSYMRLNLTIMRNCALVETYSNIISGEKKMEEGKKAPKLQDLVRLHDIIIQNLNEISQLAGLESDLELKHSLEGQIIAYKAQRCYHVADSFVKLEKWSEALVLYERTLKHIESAKRHKLEPKLVKTLDKLAELVDSKKFTAHAQAILAAQTTTPDTSKAANKEKRLLIDRMDKYLEDSSLTGPNPLVATVPPAMTPVPCKPLFFDLAFNNINFPSLEDKIEKKKEAPAAAGILGGVKGWLWGSK
ncbi:unnamed protein product, partial [Meganyctiphanes norvegica]